MAPIITARMATISFIVWWLLKTTTVTPSKEHIHPWEPIDTGIITKPAVSGNG